MIPEIGIVVALFVVARLFPESWSRTSIALRALAIVVAILVVADLTIRGLDLWPKPTVGDLESKAEEPVASIEEPPRATVSKADGGPNRTVLGYGFVVGKGSSLKREWIAIHDPSFPVELLGTPGITTIYKSKSYGGDYFYTSEFRVEPSEALSAVEVRFLVFDIWGDHVRTLSFETVRDITAGKPQTLEVTWNVFSENEVENHYASIAYVARARLASGKVVSADVRRVVEEAQKFSEKFRPEDLEQTPPPKT